MARTTRQMSDVHEEFLAKLFDGKRTVGSGNQFHDQADVRNDVRRQFHAYAVDGKSTFASSISVTRAMWGKLVEQAHDLAPALALRFYDDETLRRSLDLVVVEANDFQELLLDARDWRRRS